MTKFSSATALVTSAILAPLLGVGIGTASAEESLPILGTTWHQEGSSNIYFTLQDNQISGNDGCNAFGGEAILKGSTLSVGSLASTMRYCGDGYDLTTILSGTLEVTTQGNTLTLSDAKGGSWHFQAQN